MKVNRIAVPGIGVPGIAVAAGAALLLAGCSGTTTVSQPCAGWTQAGGTRRIEQLRQIWLTEPLTSEVKHSTPGLPTSSFSFLWAGC